TPCPGAEDARDGLRRCPEPARRSSSREAAALGTLRVPCPTSGRSVGFPTGRRGRTAEVGSDVALENRREVDGLDHVAVEGINVNATAFRTRSLLRLRGLRRLRRFLGRGRLLPSHPRLRRRLLFFRGRLFLLLRGDPHTPCFDSRET